MAHNRSDRKIISDVLASPAAQFSSWCLEVDCLGRHCARGRCYIVGDLVGVYRPDTMGELMRRLRCGMCKSMPAHVVLWSDLPAQRTTRTRRVALV